MAFSYNNLLKVLEGKKMTKEDLKRATGMSSATIAKLEKNENISMQSLDKICEVLECKVEDVIEFIPTRENKKTWYRNYNIWNGVIQLNNDRLKDLEKRLWDTADELRANTGLKASEYSTPILGLIFLKFIDSKYNTYEEDIKNEYEELKGRRREKAIEEIAIEKCGFYLPKESRYGYLLNLREEEDIAKKIKEAIEGIEKHSAELLGILPKDSYHNLSKEDNNKVLNRLLRNFNVTTDVLLRICNALECDISEIVECVEE